MSNCECSGDTPMATSFSLFFALNRSTNPPNLSLTAHASTLKLNGAAVSWAAIAFHALPRASSWLMQIWFE